MNCSSCGAVIADGDLFCSQCGTSVDAVQPVYSEPCNDEQIRPYDVVGWQCRSPMMVVLAILVSIAFVPLVVQVLSEQPDRYDLWYMASANRALRKIDEMIPYIFHYGKLIGMIVTVVGAWLMVYPCNGRLRVGTRVAAIGVRVVAGSIDLIVLYVVVGAIIGLVRMGDSGMYAYRGMVLLSLIPALVFGLFVSFLRSVAKMLESMNQHADPEMFCFETFCGKAVGTASFLLAALYGLGLMLNNTIANSGWGWMIRFLQPSWFSVVWIALWICLGLFAVKYEFDARNTQE